MTLPLGFVGRSGAGPFRMVCIGLALLLLNPDRSRAEDNWLIELREGAPRLDAVRIQAEGGRFDVAGWQAQGPRDLLRLEAKDPLPFEGMLEVSLTGIVWQKAAAAAGRDRKIHFINLFSNPLGDHHVEDGGTSRDAIVSLRVGSDEKGEPRYGKAIKVLWASRGAKRSEGSDYHEQRLSPPEGFAWSGTHRIAIRWSRNEQVLEVLVDGNSWGRLPWNNQEEPFRYVFLGRGGDFHSWVGPVFQDVELRSTSASKGGEKGSADVVAEEASPYPSPPYRPPAEHPRILFRAEDLESLRGRMAEPNLHLAWEEVRYRASLPEDFRASERYDPDLLRSAEANALLFALEGEPSLGRKAYREVLRALEDASLPFARKKDDTRAIGHGIYVAACVYDWCYELLSIAERAHLMERIKKAASRMEIGYPPRRQGAITGHGGEAQLFRDLLAAGIAVYDEDPSLYEWAAGRFYAEFVAPRDYHYAGAFHHQGSAYGHYRFYWEIWSALLLEGMGAPPPFRLELMSQVPEYFLHLRRPDGGLFEDGDDYMGIWNASGSYWTAEGAWLLYASYFRDTRYLAEYRRQMAHLEAPAERLEGAVLEALFLPLELPVNEAEELPRARYFPEPLGAFLLRDDWKIGTDSDAVAMYLKAGTHRFGNHQHADSGQFQIFHRAPLAIDSGLYQSPDTKYGGAHFRNYYQRTVAHNSILIEVPDEVIEFNGEPVAHSGGQRSPAAGRDPRNMTDFVEQDRRTAQILEKAAWPSLEKAQVVYLKSDLGAAYAAGKVSRVERTFLARVGPEFPSGGQLMVRDWVEPRSDSADVRYLLHMLDEPVVENGSVRLRVRHPLTERLLIPCKGHPGKVIENSADLAFDWPNLDGRELHLAELVIEPTIDSGPGRVRVLVMHEDGQYRERTTFEVKRRNEPYHINLTEAWREPPAMHGLSRIRLECDPGVRLWGDGHHVREPFLAVVATLGESWGDLVQHSILPRDARTERIGGPGKEFVSAGQNWPATPRFPPPLGSDEAGSWRVEVRSPTPGGETCFLHVVEVGSAKRLGGPYQLEEFPGRTLLRGPGLAVAMSSDGRSNYESCRLTLDSEVCGPDGLCKVVAIDLKPGDWYIRDLPSGRVVAAMPVEGNSGMAVWHLPKGEYRLESSETVDTTTAR